MREPADRNIRSELPCEIFRSAAVLKTEAHTADCRKQRLSRRFRQLPAQIPDVNIDDVALGIEVHVPDFFQERRPADYLLRI